MSFKIYRTIKRVQDLQFNVAGSVWKIGGPCDAGRPVLKSWHENYMSCARQVESTRWFKYDRDWLCVNKSRFVPVIFEPPCISTWKAEWSFCYDIKMTVLRQGFDPRPLHVRFIVDRVALEQGFLQVFWYYLLSIIVPVLHTHLHIL